MPIVACPARTCVENRTNGRLIPQTRGSKFVKYQELRLQEIASQVPVGHVPRSLTVHLTGELTRQCNAGDLVKVTGIFLAEMMTGFKAIRSGLTANTFVEGMMLEKCVQSFEDDELDDDAMEELERVQQEGQIYGRLAQSIAPEIELGLVPVQS